MAKTLYVEDDKTLREEYAEELRFEGHEVTTAISAEEAINIVKSQKFDVILSDNSLGKGLRGVDLAQRLSEDESTTPFILFSTDSWDDIRKHDHVPQTTPELGKPISAYFDKTDSKSFDRILDFVARVTNREKGNGGRTII